MNDKEKHLVGISTLTGVSNWLTVLPITEFGFELSKQQFWDSGRLRYGWENMQSTNILSQLQERWLNDLGHNDLRDITATMMSEVCKDIEIALN